MIGVLIAVAVVITLILVFVDYKREPYAGVQYEPAIVRNPDGSIKEVLGTKYYIPHDQPYYVQEFVRTKFPTWTNIERRDFEGVHSPAWIANLDPAPPIKFPEARQWGIDYATYNNVVGGKN